IALAVLFGIPALRRYCRAELSIPLPPGRKLEVAVVAAAKLSLPLAFAGAIALWYWVSQGGAALENHMLAERNIGREQEAAFSDAGVVRHLLLFSFVGPIVEELIFRGLLYRAWERQWGWIPAMLLTSALFAAYHPHFASAFLASIVFVCLYRRTGTL